MELVSKAGIKIPAEVERVIDLTDYAVEARYPGEKEPISEEEYEEALKLAEVVFDWVSQIIKDFDV